MTIVVAGAIASTLLAAPYDTQDCRRSPSDYTCTVVQKSPGGQHALVREQRGAEGQLVLVSLKTGKQYEEFGLSDSCIGTSEGGTLCSGVGMLRRAEFKSVRGMELVDLRYEGESTRANLCGRNVPPDYLEGPARPLQLNPEAVNESRTPGTYLFSQDREGWYEEDLRRIKVVVRGDEVYLGFLDYIGVEEHFTLYKRVYLPGVQSVRFGRAQDAAGDGVSLGGGTSGKGIKYVIVLETPARTVAYGHVWFREVHQFVEYEILPNGAVDRLDAENRSGGRQLDYLCDEYL